MRKKAEIKGAVVEMPGDAPPVIVSDEASFNEVVEKKEPEVTSEMDAFQEALVALQKLLSIGKVAASVASHIANEQVMAYHNYKRRTGRRRLNEKESFQCFSAGAAMFVTRVKNMQAPANSESTAE